MTTASITAASSEGPARVQARPSPALRDVASIAGRALRAVPRELETVIPPVFIALFFFVVNIGTLQRLTESHLKGFATWNPVTYVLEGLRSLVTQGWQWDSLVKAVLAIIAVGLVSVSLCLAALRGRTRRG